ncbi:MAG TPA: DUF5676 family membrane protein [Sphingomonadales bacterium]|nr:DUF5676 family membrane protein [Sphingomonadales bacterium]
MNAQTAPSGALSIKKVGLSLGAFFGITYLVCVAWGLAFPSFEMHPAWAPLLPGFVWLTWPGFLLGLLETHLYGWYTAAVFVPLYNYFSK